jgi:hypothetical protein
VKAIHHATGQRDGSRRVAWQLQGEEHPVARYNKTRRSMGQAGMAVRPRKPLKQANSSRDTSPVASHLLAKELDVGPLNQV